MSKFLNKIPRRFRDKRAAKTYAICVVVFLMVNAIISLTYSSRSFPRTTIAGQEFGSLTAQNLAKRLNSSTLLPEKVTLTYKDKETQTTPSQLGIELDKEKTVDAVIDNRSWLPVWDLVAKHDTKFSAKVDDQKLQKFVKAYASKHQTKPVDAKFALKNGEIIIVAEKSGDKLNDQYVAQTIIETVASGQAKVVFQPEVLAAEVTGASLDEKASAIKKQQQTRITLRYGAATKTFTPADIASWYEIEGHRAELADGNIQSSITSAGIGFGILVKNLAEAVAAAKDAINTGKALEFTLIAAPKPSKSFTYCLATRGVPTSHLGGLSSKLASTYRDKRGWGIDGQVKLSQAASGCNFTVWLAAADQMPTFGSICDPTWSCRVGPNVVINFTRWQNASPAWNASGGSLDDYRTMVINHETGHWFGFYHSDCGGAGQPAPVMQQQSINLQGCKFNPWPLASEQQSLKRSLGI